MIFKPDFKSDPNKTTAENINAFLEKKNNNIHNFDPKPKFATINTSSQIKTVEQGAISAGITSGGSNLININPVVSLVKQEQLVKNEDNSDVDSDLDVFVRIYLYRKNKKRPCNLRRRKITLKESHCLQFHKLLVSSNMNKVIICLKNP